MYGGVQGLQYAFPHAPLMGLASQAFTYATRAAAENRRNARIRSQFPELPPAETDFFGNTPGLSERDYATLAEHGRASDIGAGWHLSVTPEGFQARPSPVRQRYDETQLGVTPGDMAYDNYMAAHAQMLVPGDPRHTLTQAALDQYGLPPGSTQADLFNVAPPTTGIYDEPEQTAVSEALEYISPLPSGPFSSYTDFNAYEAPGRTFPGGDPALDFGAVPGGTDRWGNPAAPRTVDERKWENASAEAALLGEWDPVIDPITGMVYNPETGAMEPYSTADFSYDFEDQYSKAGLEAFGYQPGTASDEYAQLDKNAEVIAQYHADQEAVSKEVAGITSLTPGDWTSYTDFSVEGDREKAGREATAREVAGGGQGEDDSYGFGSMDDTDYGMGY
jgi:hypothetical protein